MTDRSALLAACSASPYDTLPVSVLADWYEIDGGDAAKAHAKAHEYRLQAAMMQVLLDPGDDEPRLRYAEMVGGERGEFVRMQCELAKLHCLKSGMMHTCNPTANGPQCEELRRRERELFDSIWESLPCPKGFITTLGPVVPNPYKGTLLLSRGWPGSLTCSWSDFQAHADKLLWWSPRTCGVCEGEGYAIYERSDEGVPLRISRTPCSACRGKGAIPGATMGCPNCMNGHNLIPNTMPGAFFTQIPIPCKTCSGSGRAPRPWSREAMPITTVTLTTWPSAEVFTNRLEDGLIAKGLRERWPSVEKWNLPTQPPRVTVPMEWHEVPV